VTHTEHGDIISSLQAAAIKYQEHFLQKKTLPSAEKTMIEEKHTEYHKLECEYVERAEIFAKLKSRALRSQIINLAQGGAPHKKSLGIC
jgi:hypothetical protein